LIHGNEGDLISLRVENINRVFHAPLKDADDLDFTAIDIKNILQITMYSLFAFGSLIVVFAVLLVCRKRKKTPPAGIFFLMFAFLIFLFALFPFLVLAPPAPHNVEGRVFNNASNSGVQNGLPVTINNTVNRDFVLTYTDAPDVPELKGIYSASINGTDGDLVVVTSWNSTHYGRNSSTLAATTTTINVALNTTRQSEANVTILELLNNSVKNKTLIFNLTANVSILGNDGIGCNATINFSNPQIINISSGENITHSLGDINMGSFKLTNWSVQGLNEGASNITVRAFCSSDGTKLENYDIISIFNVTIQNLAPTVRVNPMPLPIDLLAGDNLTLFCNASFNDGNSASDIKIANATFFQQDIGHNAPDDNNNHYTNNSCTNVSSSTFEINYTCGIRVRYYANNGSWHCNVTASDFSNITSFANISAVVNELMAVQVEPNSIDYGKLMATNISSADVNITMRNIGNIPINITVRAFAPSESLAYLNLSMNCEIGNISNANQRFSTMNGTNYSQMRKLNNETIFMNLSLPQRSNDAEFGNDTNLTFWKLQVPAATAGACNGTVIFSTLSAK
jgi:hypothetical protein